jgi:hypothetical protein
MGLFLIILLIVVLLVTLPTWPYSRRWGYGPSGFLTVALVVVLILIFLNVLGFWSLEVHRDGTSTEIKVTDHPENY